MEYFSNENTHENVVNIHYKVSLKKNLLKYILHLIY